MDSREALCSLFEIPKDEEIYESFTCQFHANINSTGKLYCCENYLCFYASVMGVAVKNVTPVDTVEHAVVGEDFFEMTLKAPKSKVDLTFELLASSLFEVPQGFCY